MSSRPHTVRHRQGEESDRATATASFCTAWGSSLYQRMATGPTSCPILQSCVTSPLLYRAMLGPYSTEGTLKDHQSNPSATNSDTYSSIRSSEPPSLTLSVSRDRAPNASLGNLGQCLTALSVQNFFLTSNLNLPSNLVQQSDCTPSKI